MLNRVFVRAYSSSVRKEAPSPRELAESVYSCGFPAPTAVQGADRPSLQAPGRQAPRGPGVRVQPAARRAQPRAGHLAGPQFLSAPAVGDGGFLCPAPRPPGWARALGACPLPTGCPTFGFLLGRPVGVLSHSDPSQGLPTHGRSRWKEPLHWPGFLGENNNNNNIVFPSSLAFN